MTRPPKSPALRIEDMLEAIAGLRATITGVPIDDLAHDWMRRSAVERGFEIISEASRHIPEDLKSSEPGIAWSSIAGLGNVLRHDYANVSLSLLLRTWEDEIPALETALHRLLARL